jgi:hypothetical protein
MSKKRTFQRPTFAEQREMEKIMHGVIVKNEDGTFSYKQGWNDERVAKTVRDSLTLHAAAAVRKIVFGPLIKKEPPQKTISNQEVKEIIEELEAFKVSIKEMEELFYSEYRKSKDKINETINKIKINYKIYDDFG